LTLRVMPCPWTALVEEALTCVCGSSHKQPRSTWTRKSRSKAFNSSLIRLTTNASTRIISHLCNPRSERRAGLRQTPPTIAMCGTLATELGARSWEVGTMRQHEEEKDEQVNPRVWGVTSEESVRSAYSCLFIYITLARPRIGFLLPPPKTRRGKWQMWRLTRVYMIGGQRRVGVSWRIATDIHTQSTKFCCLGDVSDFRTRLEPYSGVLPSRPDEVIGFRKWDL
jgi:hypothetical protein